MLWALTELAPKQLFALPILLVPIVIAGIASGISAASFAKRADGSQAAVLAAAGSYLAYPIFGSNGYFGSLLCVILLVGLFNVSRAVSIAPLGPALLFAALISPSSPTPLVVSLFSVSMVFLTMYFGRREAAIAQTSMSFAATLYLLNAHSVSGAVSASIAVLIHVFAVYFLRGRRRRYGADQTERRMFLDELVVLASIALFLKIATDLAESNRFLIVASLFACTSIFHTMIGPRLQRTPIGQHWRGFLPALTWKLDQRKNTAVAAMTVALVLAVRAGTIDIAPAFLLATKALAICALGLLLYRRGAISCSSVQKDAGKIILAYAVVFAYPQTELVKAATLPGILFIAFAVYYSIACAVAVCNCDLRQPAQGAWQSIFSGRALAQIRRTRSRVFEVISQAPLIGWMFGLGDKAATGLREAFGGRAHWTISNYVIIFSVVLGQFSTYPLIFDFLTIRLPEYGLHPLGQVDIPEDGKLQSSLSTIVSIVIYSAAVFGIGARSSLPFIMYMATLLAGFSLATNWFGALDSKNPTSGFFFPMGFVCFMAMARLMSRVTSQKPAMDQSVNRDS